MVLDSLRAAVMRRWPYLVIVLVSLVLTYPLASGQRWPGGHDGLRYHFLLDHFRDCFTHGNLYPRYLPNAFGGYGYPTFLFYQPAFFYIALPFAILFGNLVIAVYLAVLLLFVAGGIGAYKLCEEITDRYSALFCGCFFLITPYIYVNLFVRNDLSELTAMLLTPWALYWLLRLQKACEEKTSRVSPMIGLGGIVFVIMISHPATSLFFFPTLGIVTVYIGIRMPVDKVALLRSAVLAGLLGLALSAPYWVTLFQMKSCVDHQFAIGGYYRSSQHVVYPSQLFTAAWGFGLSQPGEADEMPFSLGLPHCALALIGATCRRRMPIIQISFLLYVALIVLMLPIAQSVWDQTFLLQYVQFPWRILSVVAVLQILCIAGAFQSLALVGRERILLLVTLFSLSANWYVEQFSVGPKAINRADIEIQQHHQKWLTEFFTYASANEFTPYTALQIHELGPRNGRELVEAPDRNRRLSPLPKNGPYFIRYAIDSGPAANIIVNQVYLPGWRVMIDGRPVSRAALESQLSPDGRIQIQLPADGSHTLEAYYDGPPLKWWRNLAILGVIVLFGAVCIRDLRKKRSLAQPEVNSSAMPENGHPAIESTYCEESQNVAQSV